jgi:hypothetical protein
MPSKSRRWIVGVGVPALAVAQAHADDQIGYAHESYVEDHGRMSVETDTVRVQATISPWLDTTIRAVYDGISGATPIGAPAINQLMLRQAQSHAPILNAAITGFARSIHGLSDALIDIGQDLRVRGHGPEKDAWYIGLEEPNLPGQCWTCVRLTDHGIATSGDYFRCFWANGRRYGHILDPRIGEPVRNGCQAVTVIAPTCVMAGILSTAAFILGPGEGLEMITYQSGAEACITTDAARHQTRRFSNYVPA